MLFSSIFFLWIFLPFVIIIYLLSSDKNRNIILLIFSLIFYAWGEPRYILLLLISIAINFEIGLLISKKKKKMYLIIDILFNLSILIFYKYLFSVIAEIGAFFISDISDVKKITLPLGISFYTFQILSYIVDLYKGEVEVQKNILNFALYVSLFPQLVAGPIVKYKDIEKQIIERKINFSDIYYGIKRFVMGLGKKVIISNSLAQVSESIFANGIGNVGTVWSWIGVFFYSLQIYYDFSGYSDMAIGLGRIFGFKFMENFDYPYTSKSIKEFWRRWHISLSTWFRDYIYIPLGGNRKGSIKTYCNLWIVFLVTGIWHGATLNYWLWGLWHGLFIFLERLFLGKILKKNKMTLLNYIYVLFVVIVGWAMFKCDSLLECLQLLRNMFIYIPNSSNIFWYNVLSIRNIIIFVVSFFAVGFIQRKNVTIYYKLFDEENSGFCEFIYLIAIYCLCCLMLVSGQYNPFIYFKF